MRGRQASLNNKDTTTSSTSKKRSEGINLRDGCCGGNGSGDERIDAIQNSFPFYRARLRSLWVLSSLRFFSDSCLHRRFNSFHLEV